IKVHAGATVSGSATADAGNVKFSPDAPTATAQSTTGTLTAGTYYYEITAVYAGDGSTVTTGTNDLALGSVTVGNLAGFSNDGGVVQIGTTLCHYSGVDVPTSTLTGIAGCTGSPTA